MADRCIFIWTISHFKYLKKKVGEELESRNFHYGGDTWCLRLYKKGFNENSMKYLGLYVHRKSATDTEVPTLSGQLKLSVLDKDEKAYYEMSTMCEFSKDVTSCGFSNFIERKTLKDEKIRIDDTLKFRCDLTLNVRSQVNNNSDELTDDDILQRGRTKLSDHLQAHFQSTTPTHPKDVALAVMRDGPEVMVHKCLLSARSPVFGAFTQFDHVFNKDTVLILQYADLESMKLLVKYMYTGTLDDVDALVLFTKMLVLAARYQIYGLKELCSEIMIEKMNLDNVTDYIKLAHRFNMKKLKRVAWDFVKENIDGIEELPESVNDMPAHLLPELFAELNMN